MYWRDVDSTARGAIGAGVHASALPAPPDPVIELVPPVPGAPLPPLPVPAWPLPPAPLGPSLGSPSTEPLHAAQRTATTSVARRARRCDTCPFLTRVSVVSCAPEQATECGDAEISLDGAAMNAARS
jgi:hypothetical protein